MSRPHHHAQRFNHLSLCLHTAVPYTVHYPISGIKSTTPYHNPHSKPPIASCFCSCCYYHSYLGRSQRLLVGPEPSSVAAGIATAVQLLTHSGSEGGLLLVDDLPPHPAAVAALLEALEAGVAVAAVLEGYSCLEELVAVADGRGSRNSSSGGGLVSEQLHKASAVVRGAWRDWEADHGDYQQGKHQQQEEVKREQQQFASMLLEALGLLDAGPASQANARAEGSETAASVSSSGGGGGLHTSSSSTHGPPSAQEAAGGKCYLVDMQAPDRCVPDRECTRECTVSFMCWYMLPVITALTNWLESCLGAARPGGLCSGLS